MLNHGQGVWEFLPVQDLSKQDIAEMCDFLLLDDGMLPTAPDVDARVPAGECLIMRVGPSLDGVA